MTDKQPDALRLADALSVHVQAFPQMSEDEPGSYCSEFDQLLDEAVALLSTQHAAIERKDALLRQALDLVHEAQTYTESPAWSPSMTKDLQTLSLAITKELQ